MEFRILGPLEARHEGGEVSLGGPKPRALLALLLLHRNEVVSSDRLIDEFWGADSPERAAAALRVNVSRLRKALPENVLATRSPGYVVQIEPDALDLHRFERLVDEGRKLLARGLAADASVRLRDALSLWRGPALVDFAYESFAQSAIARLDEIRLAAVELRIDADLALGRHDGLVAELEALVAEHPLRERLRMHLMRALYRSGRQAEALDAYQHARHVLVDELGIEPSTELQEVERAILRHDPSLDLEAPPTAERSILVAITDETRVAALLAVAERLVRDPPRVIVLARLVSDAAELRSVCAWLEQCRSELEVRDVIARTASFTSAAPGAELARLAAELDVELVLADAPDELLAEELPANSLLPCSRGHPATSLSSLPGTRRPTARSSFRSEERSTIGRRSSSARGLRAPAMCRSGSQAPRQCRSKANATRAASCPTARSLCSASSGSRPSRCSRLQARRACWRRPATPACSSSGCRRGGTARVSARPASGSRGRPRRRRCSCGEVYAREASRRPRR